MSNCVQTHDDLLEQSAHIECSEPRPAQKVECVIDSINCTDSTLQFTIDIVRANTNNMREYFEAASSSLIEVCPSENFAEGIILSRFCNNFCVSEFWSGAPFALKMCYFRSVSSARICEDPHAKLTNIPGVLFKL